MSASAVRNHHPSLLRLHHGPSQAFTGGVYHRDAPRLPASFRLELQVIPTSDDTPAGTSRQDWVGEYASKSLLRPWMSHMITVVACRSDARDADREHLRTLLIQSHGATIPSRRIVLPRCRTGLRAISLRIIPVGHQAPPQLPAGFAVSVHAVDSPLAGVLFPPLDASPVPVTGRPASEERNAPTAETGPPGRGTGRVLQNNGARPSVRSTSPQVTEYQSIPCCLPL